MDKISEYIPLLIILVSLIITAVGKKKKSGKITQETVFPGETAGDFFEESNFPQTFSGSYQKPVVEKPKEQIHRKPEKKITTFPATSVILDSEEEGNSPFSFEDEDDVMKAIVYTEIINRKEY